MKIELTAKNTRISEKAKQYALEKAEKLDRYYDRITGAHIFLEEDKALGMRVEIVLGAGGGSTFVAHEIHSDVFTAIDQVVGKMQRQLRKHKEKLRDRHRKSGPKET